MANTQWPRHCKIIPQSIGPPLLQSRCSTGLHHASYILYQLAHTGSYFSSSNSNYHAFWLSSSLTRRHSLGWSIASTKVRALLLSLTCHFCGKMVMPREKVEARKYISRLEFYLANHKRDLDKRMEIYFLDLTKFFSNQNYTKATCLPLRGERSTARCPSF